MRRTFSLTLVALCCDFLLVGTPVSRADGNDCDITTSETVDATRNVPFSVSGKHGASVSQNVEEKGSPHFDGTVQTQYCFDKAGKVSKARITLDGSINVPAWKDEAITPDKNKPFIKSYLAFLGAHEGRHAAIQKKIFKNVHTQLIGKTESQANTLIKKLECDEAKEHYALDKKEGKIVVNWNANTDVCTQTISPRERPEYLKICQ
jgi:hypothetical protein